MDTIPGVDRTGGIRLADVSEKSSQAFAAVREPHRSPAIHRWKSSGRTRSSRSLPANPSTSSHHPRCDRERSQNGEDGYRTFSDQE
jgi:hypothetical protein